MRKGFTLVELIFVIVIIGVLSAVAVPKFKSLKQSAEASSVIKVAEDAYSSVPAAYVNLVDLEDENITKLSELVGISGKGWDTTTSDTVAKYTDAGGSDVATLTLDTTNRNIKLEIDCSGFADTLTSKKCGKIITGTENATATKDKNVTF